MYSLGVAGRATICFQYASDIAAVTPKKFIAIAIRQLYYPGVYYPIDSLVYCFQNKVRHASDFKSLAYSYTIIIGRYFNKFLKINITRTFMYSLTEQNERIKNMLLPMKTD